MVLNKYKLKTTAQKKENENLNPHNRIIHSKPNSLQPNKNDCPQKS